MARVPPHGAGCGLGALAVSSGGGGGEVKGRDGLFHAPLPALALGLAVCAVAGRLLARARYVGGVRVRWVLHCSRPDYRKVRQERKEDGGGGQCFISHLSRPISAGFQQRWQDAGSNNGWTPSLRSWIVQLVIAPVASCFNLVESPHFSCLLPGVKSLPPKGVSLVCGGAHLQVAGVYGGPPVVGRHAHRTPPGGVGHRVGLGDTSCLRVSNVETASNNVCHTIGRTG